MDWLKLQYAMGGLFRRGRQKRTCPSCGSQTSHRVDHKGFHELLRCDGCKLLYRWPYESQAETARFYQRTYKQKGLTTDLPDTVALDNLLATGFRGSEKDFSRVVKLLKTLSVPPGARILDFGANWGYGVRQFRQAGFEAIGYEVSEPRAAYSKNLEAEVFTDWSEITCRAPFDVVFSSHVLEHTPDPAEALRRQLEVVSQSGLLIALFPNGSEVFQKTDATAFHHLWGRVHPVMLNENFVCRILPDLSLAIGSYCRDDLEEMRRWDRETTWTGTLNTGEMLIVGTYPKTDSANLIGD